MTKEQKDNAIELLFEIYDAGVQYKTVDLTGYLNDLNKELSLHNVSQQRELLLAFREFYHQTQQRSLLSCFKEDVDAFLANYSA